MSRALLPVFTLALLLAGCRPSFSPEGGYLEPPPDGARVRCPVSGQACTKDGLTEAAVWEGRTYYFCCADCRTQFLARLSHLR